MNTTLDYFGLWGKYRSKKETSLPELVYAPYLPVVTEPIITGNFNPSKSISSRYSTTTVDNRYYNKLTIDSELISVQPMEAPTGMIFYLDYVYGDWKSNPYKYLLIA